MHIVTDLPTTAPHPFPDIETQALAPSGYRAWWRTMPGCYVEAPTKAEAIERLKAQRAEQEAE